VLVGELECDYPSAAACLAEGLPALCVHLSYPLRLRAPVALDEPAGALIGGGQATDQAERAVPRRDQLPEPVMGGPGPVHRQLPRVGVDADGAAPTDADAGAADGVDAGVADGLG
jgi:hypothetical protein